ncbi:MAG: S8 family serine peptidase [Bacteroidetes bacterium]|nr:S8 family serine peptidase [Bacteroidota bacterium]
MNRKIIISIFIISLALLNNEALFSQNFFKLPENTNPDNYIAKTIIFKIKPEFRTLCSDKSIENKDLKNIFSNIGVQNFEKKFPLQKVPTEKKNKYGQKLIDLSLIYELNYTKNIGIEEAINQIKSIGIFEYVEPHYLPQLLETHNSLYTPNDPFISSQYYLTKIKAIQAWDISKGDSSIVIGISDTGTDTLHPDLINSVKYNWEDPIDGIDNDNDGYIDNFQGWNLGENNNKPQVNVIKHGVFVSGVSSATSNNGTGISGVGFNTKFLPIKIDDNNGVLTKAYESIIYAADHGCQVINCSWGGSSSGQFGQDIIDYAIINKDAIVVAACGNANSQWSYFPASYNGVLSVAATDINDVKWTDAQPPYGSSYGIYVGISAPGAGIYSTWYPGTYLGSQAGTSFAAPIVSACAAITRFHFPQYSAMQIVEQLKVTADYIDTIPANIPFATKLGTGRVNLLNALTSMDKPSIKMTSQNYTALEFANFAGGDTLDFFGDFTNYLQPSINANVVLSSTSSYVSIIDSTLNLGAILTMGVKNSNYDPFKIALSPSLQPGQKIEFKLHFTDGSYSGYQLFSVTFNADFVNLDTNKVATTITSIGRLGYKGIYMQDGLGITYNGGVSLLGCGGLIVGNSSSRVSDNTYGAVSGYFDNDFKSLVSVKKVIPAVESDVDIKGIFNDDNAGSSKLSIEVSQKALAWNTLGNEKFIILEFTIKNVGTSSLNSLYAGLFADWDINYNLKNRIKYDSLNRMGYTYSTGGSVYAGIKLLTNGPIKHYAFDNNGASNEITNSIRINDGFTSYEKWSALKGIRSDAGINQPDTNDVSDMVSTGPFILAPLDTIKVAYAIILGDHLADIQSSAIAADEMYNHTSGIEVFANSNNVQFYCNPNPSSNFTTLQLNLSENRNIDLNIFNSLGQIVMKVCQEKLNSGIHDFKIDLQKLPEGIYFCNLKSSEINKTLKLIIQR